MTSGGAQGAMHAAVRRHRSWQRSAVAPRPIRPLAAGPGVEPSPTFPAEVPLVPEAPPQPEVPPDVPPQPELPPDVPPQPEIPPDVPPQPEIPPQAPPAPEGPPAASS